MFHNAEFKKGCKCGLIENVDGFYRCIYIDHTRKSKKKGGRRRKQRRPTKAWEMTMAALERFGPAQ